MRTIKAVYMKISFLSMCIFLLASPSYSADPSPNLKQLKVGCYTYSSSSIWQSSETGSDLREWYANHYSFLIGSGTGALERVDTMRTFNSELKALLYSLFILSASDTIAVKVWADSVGVNFDSLIIRAKDGVGDSLRCRITDLSEEGFGRWVTTQPGQVLIMPGFTSAQTRFCWDFRNPNVGVYLSFRWKNIIESFGYDGVFVDEEGIIGYTGHITVGNFPLQYPFRFGEDNKFWDTTDYNPWYHTENAWDSTLTHAYGGSEVRDSLNVLRGGWMGTAGDSLQAWGYFYAPNFAAIPHSSMANWDTEGRRCAVLAGGYALGEYCYNYPSLASAGAYERYCNEAVEACYDIRDSTVNMFVGWIRMGQYDSSATDNFTIARSRMNGLGLMLDCLFEGNSEYYFSPCAQNGQVDWIISRTLDGITLPDSTTHWDYAWGKYFGEPLDTRDTSDTGTDGEGQVYTIHKIALLDSAGSSDTLTYAIGRYGKGTNRLIGATSMYTDLPTGTWWELESGGTWGSSYTDSVLIANAQWRIFSSDTVLSNNGPGESPIDAIPPVDIDSLGAIPGDEHGQIVLSWTAPGDDGDSGTADHYIIKYSTDIINESNWTSADTLSSPPDPLPAGSDQTCVISGLSEGQIYYVGVKTYDEAGNVSNLSNVPDTFASGIMVPTQISTEIDLANNSVEVTSTAVESYMPVYYEFVLDSVDNFPDPVISLGLLADTVVSTTFGGLSQDISYFWRCITISSDNNDSSSWSPTIEFNLVTGVAYALSDSDCIYPTEGEIVHSRNPVFTVRYVPNVENIFFQIGNDSLLNAPIESGLIMTVANSSTNWQITEPIEQGVTYYWRVSDNNTVWTSPISFSALLEIHPYPNPFRPSEGHTSITFTNLLQNSSIIISTISGKIILREDKIGPDDWVWDVKNDRGNKLAPGVYLYAINFPSGSSNGKVLVIR